MPQPTSSICLRYLPFATHSIRGDHSSFALQILDWLIKYGDLTPYTDKYFTQVAGLMAYIATGYMRILLWSAQTGSTERPHNYCVYFSCGMMRLENPLNVSWKPITESRRAEITFEYTQNRETLCTHTQLPKKII